MMEAGDNEISMDLGIVRPGKSPQGSKTVDMILQAAVQVLIEEGSAAFTLKRVAEECNLQIGNVTRHFPRKEMLVQLLLHEILESGEELLKSRVYDTNMSPEDALTLVITGTIEGGKAKGTTHLLSELWAMSNHNAFVAERMESLYRYVIKLIGSFVRKINPSLDEEEVEAVSLFINAAIEGTMVVGGYGKPWAAKLPLMKAVAANSLINMVKTITSEEIHQLKVSSRATVTEEWGCLEGKCPSNPS